MRKSDLRPYIFFVALTLAVGALSGFLSRGGIEAYAALEKPALSPPAVLFPIVWTILYALMGVGAARVWLSPKSDDRSQSLLIFTLQLIVNFFWSPFFFNLQAYGFSFLWLVLLWALIVWMTISFRQSDRLAALLQIPYIIWVAFAGYLNFMVWQLNG